MKISKPFCLSGVCAFIAFSVETGFPTGILKSPLRIQNEVLAPSEKDIRNQHQLLSSDYSYHFIDFFP